MSLPTALNALLSAQRVQQVPADLAIALVRLTRAEAKLTAAQEIAGIDLEVAYVTAYDATRIAITAHMLAHGYRIRALPGAHETVGVYAEALIRTPSASEFQRMRRRRNKAEYDDIVIGHADFTADLAHAQAIIDAVSAALRT